MGSINNNNVINDFIKSFKSESRFDSNEQYHGNKDYIGSTSLKLIKLSPLHYKNQEPLDTEAIRFGSAYHCFILEPEKFDKEYFVIDDTEFCNELIQNGKLDAKGNRVSVSKPRATNEYKSWYEQQISKSEGKILFDKEDLSKLEAMKSRLFSNRFARNLLQNGEAEKSYYCDLEIITGQRIGVKVKPDYCKPNKRVIVDLKTCGKGVAAKNEFPKHAADMDYHISAAMYSDMLSFTENKGMNWDFIFIAQEKVVPYAFNIFKASPQFISQGRYEYELLLQLLAWCKENDKWPGYQVFCENEYGINELSIPKYAINELEFYTHSNI